MTHTIEYTITRDGEDIDIEVEYSLSRYYPAQTYGPPEHCSPAEGGEIEEMEVSHNGKVIELTADETRKVELWIYDNNVFDGDDD